MDEISRAVIWAILGVVFIIIELVSLHFVLLFFGVAALIVAAASLFGLDSLVGEIALFAGAGVGLLVFLRRPVSHALAARGAHIGDETQTVLIAEDVQPGAEVKVEYQGSPWNATNESGGVLVRGSRATIKRVEGVRLFLGPGENR